VNVSDYKTEIGSLLHDTSNVEFSAADITRWLNRAQLIATGKTNCLQRIYTTSGVANQAEYTWPTNALKILGAMYNWDKPLYPTSNKDLRYYDEDWIQANAVTDPTHYHLIEMSRKVATYPPPSSVADTTAIDDADGITASDTTITVDSTSGFPSRGRILIGSEVIAYTNTTSTTFTGCTRGLEDTTAAVHADDAAVTLRDLIFWCVEKPTDLSVDTDIPWNSQAYLYTFHGVLIPYCLYMAKLKDGEPLEGKGFYQDFLFQVEEMKRELRDLLPDRIYQYVSQEAKEWPAGFGYKWPIQTS